MYQINNYSVNNYNYDFDSIIIINILLNKSYDYNNIQNILSNDDAYVIKLLHNYE